MAKEDFIKQGLFALVLIVVGLSMFNVGFNVFVDEPEYPDCYAAPRTIDDRPSDADIAACEAAQEAYDVEREDYTFIKFIFSLVVGVGLAIAGLYLKNGGFSWAFLLGGFVQIWIGTADHWRYLDDVTKFLLLLVGTVIVAYFGYRRLDK